MPSDRAITDQDRARGERLRALRELRDLTQEALGKLIGIDRTRVNKMENGSDKLVKRENVARLAGALDVDETRLHAYLSGTILLDEVVVPGPLRVVEKERRYPAVEELVAHLKARGEDPAVIAQVHMVAIARHGDFTDGDLATVLQEARRRAKTLDEKLGFDVDKMKRPDVEDVAKKARR